MKLFCAAMGLLVMTNQIAAQDRCPTRLDLDRGLRLIADDPQHTRLFTQDAFGASESPVDANGQKTHFADLPDWMGVNSPHAILPGIIDGPKGQATIIYLMDSYYEDMTSGYDPVFEVNALFDDLFESMIAGEQRSFDVSVDQGSWGLFGMAVWNRSDGQATVTHGGHGSQTTHQLGECSYRIVPYDFDLHMGRQTLLSETRHYAPDLGLVIGRTPLDDAREQGQTHWFTDIFVEDF